MSPQLLIWLLFTHVTVNIISAQYFDDEYDGQPESQRAYPSETEQNAENSEHSENINEEESTANKENAYGYSYGGGQKDIGEYDFEDEEERSRSSSNQREDYEEDVSYISDTDDSKSQNQSETEPGEDMEMHHPHGETSDSGDHGIGGQVNVTCGYSQTDAMEVRYHGRAYDIYTMHGGAMGCTAANIRPFEFFIPNAKSKECLPQKKDLGKVWIVELRIQKGPVRDPEVDYIYKIQCSYKTREERKITSATVNDVEGRREEITIDVLDTTKDNLTLEMTDPEGRPMTHFTLGAPMKLIAKYTTGEYIGGIKVWNCKAMGGLEITSKWHKILVEGCGIGDVIPSGEGFFAERPIETNQGYEVTAQSATFEVFKIPPTDFLYFQCTVIVCDDASGCQGSSCSRASRRKRQVLEASRRVVVSSGKIKFSKIATTGVKVLADNESLNREDNSMTEAKPKTRDQSDVYSRQEFGKMYTTLHVAVITLCGLTALVTIVTIMCCEFKRRNEEDEPEYFKTEEYVLPDTIAIATISPISSEGDPRLLGGGAAEVLDTPLSAHTAATPQQCVVRYTQGIQSDRPE